MSASLKCHFNATLSDVEHVTFVQRIYARLTISGTKTISPEKGVAWLRLLKKNNQAIALGLREDKSAFR
ncbi:hypothetical protein EHW65_05175 [Erwinia psidii]|uniref:hypothetical protein n=1 Tax=Erwinia psidii TaxID=69224 RepID=UPI00226B70EB|nr:hypothetical protein [Erwinia psidii]MCX8956694.1 hypothetical protein [Erwinia psidii]